MACDYNVYNYNWYISIGGLEEILRGGSCKCMHERVLRFSRIVIKSFSVGMLRESHVYGNFIVGTQFRHALVKRPPFHTHASNSPGICARRWRKNSLAHLLYSVHLRIGDDRACVCVIPDSLVHNTVRQSPACGHSHAFNGFTMNVVSQNRNWETGVSEALGSNPRDPRSSDSRWTWTLTLSDLCVPKCPEIIASLIRMQLIRLQ